MATVPGTYYITKDQMKGVTTYIPLVAKLQWVELIASKCLNKVEMQANFMNNDFNLPPMYKENTEYKMRYLMGVFVRLYLRGSWEVGEDEDKWLIPVDEYDKWAGGHIFAQIEKFKSDAELRDICFNLMNDFKELTRYLNTEINSLINIMNDPAARQMASTQASMTPEAMDAALKQLNEARDELMEYEEQRKQRLAEEEGTK
jgi:hypothetical protein